MPHTITIGTGENQQQIELSDEQIAEIMSEHKPAGGQPVEQPPADAGSIIKTLKKFLPQKPAADPDNRGDGGANIPAQTHNADITELRQQIEQIAGAFHDYVNQQQQHEQQTAQQRAQQRARELIDTGRIAPGEVDTVVSQLERDYDGYSALYERVAPHTHNNNQNNQQREGAQQPAGSPVFTREQIRNMSVEEFQQNESAIEAAMLAGNIS